MHRTDPESSRPAAERRGGRAGARALGASDAPSKRARLARLVPLLGDDSPRVRAVLRREFAAAGRVGLARLARLARSNDARVRAHARALRLELEREEVVRRLVRHVARPQIDLERALFLLGRFEDPRLDARPLRRALDAMGEEVAERASSRPNPIDKARVLVEYLGKELGYHGDADDYHHPDNVHLHRAIVRKRGLPLTLVALYVCVARRARLRVGALPLPGHVMLRLYGREQNLIVDPFQRGETKTQAALMTYLARNRLSFQSSWFRDADDASLFQRQVQNLVQALITHGQRREATALGRLLRALARRG